MKDEKEISVALGATDVRVSPIGVGTNTWGARRAADPEKLSTFQALLSAGVTFFDTAEIYTLGASERTIGHCIRASGTSPVVLTKFFPMPWRLRGLDLISALKRRLARLALPAVDVYLLHFPIPPVPLVGAVPTPVTRAYVRTRQATATRPTTRSWRRHRLHPRSACLQ